MVINQSSAKLERKGLNMELRLHQIKAIEMIRHSLRTGHKRPLLAAPCSFGKTITAAWLLKSAAEKGKRAIFFADRVRLVDQTISAFEALGLDFGVMQAQHYQTDTSKPIQIASIQTVARKERKPIFDLAIVDECFPAGTMIATPTGPKPIELVRCGDTVYNLIGTGQVGAVSIRPANTLIKLRFDDGTNIECTDNHPFFTNQGWKKAGELEVGSLSFSIEGVRNLWRYCQAKNEYRERSGSGGSFRSSVEQAEILLRQMQDEIGESNVEPSNTVKNESNAKGDKAQANKARWKRAITALGAACVSSRIGRGMGGRTGDSNKNEASRNWISDLLQSGFGKQKSHDCNRVRRGITLQLGAESARCEEDRLPDFSRVVGISIVKCESPRAVYNFSVSGHPSYFANGRAVHNCHTAYESLTDLMTRYDQIPFIGLSATPYSKGLGKIYDDLLVPITTQELLDQGYLCPVEYYGGRSVSLKGMKTKALRTGGSDYDPDALAEAIEGDKELAGDIVKNWQQHGVGQTIAFCPSIKHSKFLVELFLSAGISAAHIDGYMDEDERQRLHKAHDDGTIKILSCSRLLNTGYDAPTVRTLIDCFPTRSKIVFQQRAGRIFRTAPGKDKAIYLDHAGNVARHGFAESLIPSVLDDGEQNFNEERQIREREEKERRVQTCPVCQRQMMGIRCQCGYTLPIRQEIITDGTMLSKIEKVRTYTQAEKSYWYSGLLKHARSKGFSDGWAAHQYREKMGVWPRQVTIDTSKPIHKDVEGWITHRLIKYAKSSINWNKKK